MKYKGLNEIRQDFKDFFISKGHYPADSASLIPSGDKSLLIINSGMAPLKNYFAGIEEPPSKRMTTCQKCIRTGDIENVGKTSRHGTFFEMLGNFSFGDYFKNESLAWGVEFLTDILEIPLEKIWATVYEEDDEAFKIWQSLGLPKERILKLGKSDNFWEIGLGPCGPDSEIFFDRGEEYGCHKATCKPGCDCDRYIEVWNHVFTQFNKEEDGSYSNLKNPNIDTGMGLERISCIIQDVSSIFDIDTIKHILNGVIELADIKYDESGTYESDISVRIITDHLRSMVFMIGDGIIPSNEGRGYVLRRLIRRAARHGKLIGIKGGFLSELSNRVIEVSGEAYPQIVEKKDFIQKVIAVEEEKFEATLDQGLEIIKNYISQMTQNEETVLNGDKTFKLYDTFGFPLELTQEILSENGFTADIEGFNRNMQRQKDLARAGRRNVEELGWDQHETLSDIRDTEFLGYSETSSQSNVLFVKKVADDEYDVILDSTPFYAESGGQIYDIGIMSTNTIKARVLSVSKQNGIFLHRVQSTAGIFTEGDVVNCEIDVMRRNMIARNHTATHLLHKALKEILGEHVQQAGSSVTERMLRFDFNHFEAMTDDEKYKVEKLLNEKINEFLPVETTEMPIEQAIENGATALFGEKYSDVVRVVSCGDFSTELCGGTHVSNTGEIGACKIINESAVASGVRRIEALTSLELLNLASKYESILKDTASTVKASIGSIPERVKSISDELKSLRKEVNDLKSANLGSQIDAIINDAREINGINLITAKFDDVDVSELRKLTDDIKGKISSSVIILATVNNGKVSFLVAITDDLLDKGLHAGKMIKEIAAVCGGGGGGKANLAQAGAKDASKIDEAFIVAENLLK